MAATGPALGGQPATLDPLAGSARQAAPADPLAGALRQTLAPADVHVLLVDDERLSRVVVGNVLRKCSYRGEWLGGGVQHQATPYTCLQSHQTTAVGLPKPCAVPGLVMSWPLEWEVPFGKSFLSLHEHPLIAADLQLRSPRAARRP